MYLHKGPQVNMTMQLWRVLKLFGRGHKMLMMTVSIVNSVNNANRSMDKRMSFSKVFFGLY